MSSWFLFLLTDLTKELHEEGLEYTITMYSTGTGTKTHCKHVFQAHTQHYIEALECSGWLTYILTLKELIEDGWTLASILQALKDPAKMIYLLGPPPNCGLSNSLPETSGPSGNVLFDFSLDEMHCQIVKFIIADDQVSLSLSTHFYSQLSSGY